MDMFIKKLNEHPEIKAREVGDGVVSYNFSKRAFFDSIWDKTTVKARGLFVRDNTIVARGYDKFFNVNQTPGYSYQDVLETFEFPVVVSHKLNGYLAIACSLDGVLKVFSKSGVGVFTPEAQRIVENSLGEHVEDFTRFLERTNQSATFEIISSNDVHIVNEGEERAVLLDFIANKEEYVPASKEDVESVGLVVGVETARYEYVNTREELKRALDEAYTSHTEGVVLMDNVGRMTKVKSDYYLAVKSLRTPLNRYRAGKELRKNELFEALLEAGLGDNLEDYVVDTLSGASFDLPAIAQDYKNVIEDYLA